MCRLPVKLTVIAAIALALLVTAIFDVACAQDPRETLGPKHPQIRRAVRALNPPVRDRPAPPRARVPGSWLEALRRAGPFSELGVELLSDVAAKLLADNEMELLSGNAPELFSGNEAELLSDNKTKLCSENSAEFCARNRLQFLSNITLEINIQNCGNNNGTPPPPPMVRPARKPRKNAARLKVKPVPKPRKRPAKRTSAQPKPTGTLSLKAILHTDSDESAPNAIERFKALDKNGDGVLDLNEFNAPGRLPVASSDDPQA